MKTKIDPLTFDAILFVSSISITVFGGYKANKMLLYTGIILIVAAALYLWYIAQKHGAKVVKNNYSGKILFKPENSTQVQTINPGELPEIDGIIKPVYKTKDKPLRKFRNGTNVIIDENGNAKAVNFFTRIIGQSDHYPKEMPETWNELKAKVK